jgi:hypothetical protein
MTTLDRSASSIIHRLVHGQRIGLYGNGLHLKGEFPLGDIAEYGHKCRSKYLRWGREDVEYFYEQLQEDIVQEDAHTYQYEVSEQLDPAFQVRFRENDILRQRKPDRETDAERYHESEYVGRYRNACYMYRLLIQ